MVDGSTDTLAPERHAGRSAADGGWRSAQEWRTNREDG